jgi:hypothetical protein
MPLYRIYPVLWQGCEAQTVYAIDRAAPGIPSCCSSRPKADPASVWESPTFQRLLPPPDMSSCGSTYQAVTWSMIPAWLSWIQTQGYNLSGSLSKQKPYEDLYVEGP